MAVAKVLRLDEYRDRRVHRLALSRALSRADLSRSVLHDDLVEIAALTGADRVAAVWIDEYGPELVHPFAVLDLLCDRPRRHFAVEPLQRAWERGIPGAYDQGSDPDAVGNTFAIALGSDGTRAWFLWAETLSGGPAFRADVRDRLMFLAGEVSAVVLHRDLDPTDDESAPRFAAWRTLRDLEGYETDERRSRAVARRFVVQRLASMLVEEGLAVADERRAEQARRARLELARESLEGDVDVLPLEGVLRAYERGDFRELAEALVTLGEGAEQVDHHNGAVEAYACAFELAAAHGTGPVAIESARRLGRVLRRRAKWEEADRWYSIALEVARAIGDGALVARSLSGLGLVKRELGNIPLARERFEEALAAAVPAGDAEALASVHHDLMGLELIAENLPEALRHGWRAVNTYVSDSGRTRCIAGMAGVLMQIGDWSAAEDAYQLVAHDSDEHYYLVYAYDALSHIAALRGDEPCFEARARQSDALDWESGPASAKAEVLVHRGRSYAALGRTEEARSWLVRAVEFASEHKFNRTLFAAEEALAALDRAGAEPQARPSQPSTKTPAPPEVREGLRAMRENLVGV